MGLRETFEFFKLTRFPNSQDVKELEDIHADLAYLDGVVAGIAHSLLKTKDYEHAKIQLVGVEEQCSKLIESIKQVCVSVPEACSYLKYGEQLYKLLQATIKAVGERQI